MSEKEALLPIKHIFCASKGAQMRSTSTPFAQNLISRNFQYSITLEKHENKKVFELKWYFHKILHLLYVADTYGLYMF